MNHPAPTLPLFDYSALEQWRELQRLSALLLDTPFKAEGIITNITTDANGTRHIALHSEPDIVTLGRYLATSLLLLVLILPGRQYGLVDSTCHEKSSPDG